MVMGFRGPGETGAAMPMTYFVSLKIVAIVIGLFYIATHLPGALAPHWAALRARTLPRNYPLGVVLMLAATLWFVVLTGLMDLGELSNMRTQLMVVWALAGILTAIFVPGFLAVRGLGCLLLLGAAVILDGAFLVQTPVRLVMTILAYVWVIAGMVLVYSPHLGRDGIVYLVQTPRRCRLFSWPGVAFGVLLIVLGLLFYP
jgi:hypothetical protein